MNLDRLEQAIAVMKRAGKVDMGSWQRGDVSETEEELHTCGNSACFAGWIAVSPEFHEAGGIPNLRTGSPIFGTCSGFRAVIAWLEVKDELKKEVLEMLVMGEAVISDTTEEWLRQRLILLEPEKYHSYSYLMGWNKYKAQDVIKVLEALRD